MEKQNSVKVLSKSGIKNLKKMEEKMKKFYLCLIITFVLSVSLLANWTELQKILASDGTANDIFGYSVSISGDYAVIGACDNDSVYTFGGSAYMFHRIGTTWTEQVKLIPSDGAPYDAFGSSVYISGDYAVIGAYGNDDNGFRSGSAYIFHRIGTIWSEQIKLTASDGEVNDRFGSSVSIAGDYSVIGAYGDDDNGSSSGSTYIFHRIGTNWSEQIKLTASDGEANDRFGSSVSIAGDYAIIGASGDDSWSGSAYIFNRDGNIWYEQTKITASDGAVDENFGFSVSISGDYSVIGAFRDDDNGYWSGSAYIYYNDGLSVAEEPKIIQCNTLLIDNYPNPFNPTTTISFSIPEESNINLIVYNIKGQKVKQLVSNQLTSGVHSIIWNGDDDSGNSVDSGIYFYKLNVNDRTEATKKCLLLK